MQNKYKYAVATLLALGVLGGSTITAQNASAKRHVRVTRKVHKHARRHRAKRHFYSKRLSKKEISKKMIAYLDDDDGNGDLDSSGLTNTVADDDYPDGIDGVYEYLLNQTDMERISYTNHKEANDDAFCLYTGGWANSLPIAKKYIRLLNNIFINNVKSKYKKNLNSKLKDVEHSNTHNANKNLYKYYNELTKAVKDTWNARIYDNIAD
ncbi:hypothetical protein WR164_01920 [Philodulcilactobacillus myokoensis]|uniref:Uncharacterized protein n=1 Tax=Philodulcilactobacillus myokoensis TaxID=2929573 RepID=A0A9W6B0I0_9LACO|nr:hypothetical protein [Philodulcilactobacillus myokoensis]GLB46213.1 hypothetical protein WR164_01920 [Philodulcilactobacillus myokoensis]